MKRKTPKPTFSVALSQETGCSVMVRGNGEKMTVMGSLDREASLKFAEDVSHWMPDAAREVPQRPAYPH